MNEADFNSFKPYFTKDEKWGDYTKVPWTHVHHLCAIRTGLLCHGYDWPISIHCCYEAGGHASKSWHKKGEATDFHFVTNFHISIQHEMLRKILIKARLESFMGIGVYPFWNTPGFHVDGRGSSLYWYRDEKNKYHYGLPIVEEFLVNLRRAK